MDEHRTATETEPSVGSPSLIRTLIVEGDDALRDKMAHVLNSGVFKPIPVATIDAARAAFAEGLFDVIVTDLHVGKEHGRDLIGWIREQDNNVGIVVATAYRQDLPMHEAFAELDIDDVISKPFEADDLETRVLRAVTHRRQEVGRRANLRKILDSVDRLNAALDTSKTR